MNGILQLQNALPDLSRNERRIADYILKYPQNVKGFSSEALAAACDSSRSTVIRLCQKMGYQGYSEFKYDLVHNAPSPINTAPPVSEVLTNHFNSTTNALQYYCNGLLQMESLIASPVLDEIVDTLAYANRVISLGFNHSSFSAQQLSFRLNRFGIDCHTLQDPTLMANYERILKQGDAVVIFSISGRDRYKSFISEYRKSRTKVILITMTPDCTLADCVDSMVVLPQLSNASDLYPTDDAITFFMFIEIIMEALNHKLNELNSN